MRLVKASKKAKVDTGLCGANGKRTEREGRFRDIVGDACNAYYRLKQETQNPLSAVAGDIRLL